jgi:ABC-2 type transport system ATP-binding protein
MQEAEAVCNRAIIIRKGTIVADDTLAALKAHNTRRTIIVEFDQDIDPKKLGEIPGIDNVEGAGRQWQLTVSGDDTEARRAVFQFAAQNNIPLLELRRQNSSLENIFHELTF